MSDTGAVADALETADLVLEGVGPAAVLRAGVGRPRGLWSDPHGWSAWFGEATVLTATGSDRFDAIRRAARAGGLSASDRLFGGFAFHDVGDTVPRWEGFPAARFVLPAVEARGEGGGVRLKVRADAGIGASERLAEVAAAVSAAQAGPNGTSRAAAAGPPADGRSGAHEGWNANVRAALEEIAAGRLEKVVLARAFDIPAVGADPVPVAMALRADEPGAHTFLFEPTPGRAFLGAAPESIAEVTAGVLRTTAVAGSAPRGAGPEEDAALAEALLASTKDRAEQALVVRDIAQRLEALVDDLDVERGPHVIRFARIQHLETVLSGTLRPGVDILSVLAALHPTPAVGGEPRAEALAFIRRAEGFRRGWYAGPVGWFEPGGDGSFAPALRSALRREEEGWRLFAGAGIVEGSEPEKEWDETAVKLEPVLAALRRALA
jgi:menaquinone-specific isochorismate synthase